MAQSSRMESRKACIGAGGAKSCRVMTGTPVIKQFAKMWTLMDQPSADAEWSAQEKADQIQAAGFDGVHGIMDEAWVAACDARGLEKWGEFDLGAAADADALVAAEASKGIQRISVQAGDHDSTTPEMLELALALNEAAERHGVYAAIEVHRDTGTETPEKTDALVAAYREATGKQLPLNIDFSHPMVVKHLFPDSYMDRMVHVSPELVQASRGFHLRPATGHHCQIPVTDGQGNLIAEFKDWIGFVEDLLAFWMKGPREVDDLYVCPELGPVRFGGYCLSVYPNPWEDAIRCREEIARAWDRAKARG